MKIVIITPNNKVELIDTDSSFISTNEIKNNEYKILIYRQFKSMIIECLFNEQYYFNDEEVLSDYKVKREFIDKFISGDLSHELFIAFFDYLRKDKVLTLQKLNTRNKKRED